MILSLRLTAILVVTCVLGGCESVALFRPQDQPHALSNATIAQLAGDNYRFVETSRTGRSTGWGLLFILTIRPSSAVNAMNDMMTSFDYGDRSVALANVTRSRSVSNYLLFFITRDVVRADVIEYLPGKGVELPAHAAGARLLDVAEGAQ